MKKNLTSQMHAIVSKLSELIKKYPRHFLRLHFVFPRNVSGDDFAL